MSTVLGSMDSLTNVSSSSRIVVLLRSHSSLDCCMDTNKVDMRFQQFREFEEQEDHHSKKNDTILVNQTSVSLVEIEHFGVQNFYRRFLSTE